jgi:5-formyltetrahydrofolate cyclo-ligase
MDTFANKHQLRARLRERRHAISKVQRHNHEQKINAHVITCVEEFRSANVAAYWCFDGEPDLMPAMTTLETQEVNLLLPVIEKPGITHQGEATEPGNMIFRQWQTGMIMTSNAFGIPEPGDGRHYSVDEIDLMLIPLVGCDLSGNRLGMGAGYYDRFLRPTAGLESPILVGVAFECQICRHIPVDPWDVPLQHVITEKERFTCKRQSATIGPDNQNKESTP